MSDNTTTNTATTTGPKRALPIYTSVPRDITNTDPPPSHSHASTKRQSLSSQNANSTSGDSWCLIPTESSSFPLTQHQRAVAQQCHDSPSDGILALVGPRGCGKATIAAHVAAQQEQQQQVNTTGTTTGSTTLWWLHAQSESSLRASYVALLRQYAPQEKALGVLSTRQLAERISSLVLVLPQQQSASSRRITIVYQDVGVAPEVFFFQWAIPNTKEACLVLLTTSLPDYQTWKQQPQQSYQCIAVEAKLTMQDAKALLLLSSVNKDDDDDGDDNKDNLLLAAASDDDWHSLVNLLQHLPLAIRVAAAQPRSPDQPLANFVHKLRNDKDQYYHHTTTCDSVAASTTNDNDKDDLSWFWSIAIDHALVGTDHKRVLRLLSVINHYCIPQEILKLYDDNVVLELEQGQILQRQQQCQTYSIAPELQHAVRQQQLKEQDGTTQPLEALAEAVKTLKVCLTSVKPKNAVHYLPHLETLQSNMMPIRTLPKDFPREAYANVLLQMGLILQRPPFADYERAMETYRQGLGCLEDAYNNNDDLPAVAKTLYYRLGTCARLQGDHVLAKSFCLKALALYGYHDLEEEQRQQQPQQQQQHDGQPQLHQNKENTPSSEWNVLSQLFHTCGHSSWQDGQVVEARVYFEYELAVKRALYGTNQPQDRVARTLNNLGSVCRDSGDLTAAKDYSLQSLQMQKDLDMGDNLETATTLNNLGSLSYSLCEYAQAQDFLEQALAMKQRVYQQATKAAAADGSVQNLDVAETYYNLGMLADHLSHYDKAQDYYEASLDCKYAVFGRDAENAEIATSLSSLGLSAMNHGEYKKGEQYFQTALEMQNAFYRGEGNMEQVRTLHGLGMINYHLGRLQQSRKYHKQALEMQTEFEAKEKRENHNKRTFLSDPRTANLSQLMQNLANLSHNLGQYDNAREFYEQGLKLYSQVSVDSTKDEHLQHMLSNLQNLSSTSSYDAARTYYEKALEMKVYLYGEKAANSDLAFTLRSLAMLNDNAGKHQEAKECYQKALKMLHHFYGGKDAANAEIAGVLDGLGTVTFNLGEYQKSRSWLQQALTMKETVYGEAKNNDLATSHVSLGTLSHTLGGYEDARHHLETAYQMQLAVFGDLAGEQNIELGITANCLANLYRDLGETEKALALYKQAMQLMGKDNPFLASVLIDLGEFYRQQGDFEKANACLQEALRLQKQLYGEHSESAEMAALSMYLGKLYTDMENYEEAKGCLDGALQMQRSVLGHEGKDNVEHGEIADTLQALGDLMRVKSCPEDAQLYLEEAKSMRQSVYGDVQTIEMAQNLKSLVEVYAGLNDEEKTEQCQKELSDFRSKAPRVAKALDDATQRSEQSIAQDTTRPVACGSQQETKNRANVGVGKISVGRSQPGQKGQQSDVPEDGNKASSSERQYDKKGKRTQTEEIERRPNGTSAGEEAQQSGGSEKADFVLPSQRNAQLSPHSDKQRWSALGHEQNSNKDDLPPPGGNKSEKNSSRGAKPGEDKANDPGATTTSPTAEEVTTSGLMLFDTSTSSCTKNVEQSDHESTTPGGQQCALRGSSDVADVKGAVGSVNPKKGTVRKVDCLVGSIVALEDEQNDDEATLDTVMCTIGDSTVQYSRRGREDCASERSPGNKSVGAQQSNPEHGGECLEVQQRAPSTVVGGVTPQACPQQGTPSSCKARSRFEDKVENSIEGKCSTGSVESSIPRNPVVAHQGMQVGVGSAHYHCGASVGENLGQRRKKSEIGDLSQSEGAQNCEDGFEQNRDDNMRYYAVARQDDSDSPSRTGASYPTQNKQTESPAAEERILDENEFAAGFDVRPMSQERSQMRLPDESRMEAPNKKPHAIETKELHRSDDAAQMSSDRVDQSTVDSRVSAGIADQSSLEPNPPDSLPWGKAGRNNEESSLNEKDGIPSEAGLATQASRSQDTPTPGKVSQAALTQLGQVTVGSNDIGTARGREATLQDLGVTTQTSSNPNHSKNTNASMTSRRKGASNGKDEGTTNSKQVAATESGEAQAGASTDGDISASSSPLRASATERSRHQEDTKTVECDVTKSVEAGIAVKERCSPAPGRSHERDMGQDEQDEASAGVHQAATERDTELVAVTPDVTNQAPSKDGNERKAPSSSNPNQLGSAEGPVVAIDESNSDLLNGGAQVEHKGGESLISGDISFFFEDAFVPDSSPVAISIQPSQPEEETESQEGKEPGNHDNKTKLEGGGEHAAANHGELGADSSKKREAPSQDINQREAAFSNPIQGGSSEGTAVGTTVAVDEANSNLASTELTGENQSQSSPTGNPIHVSQHDEETESQEGREPGTDDSKTKLERGLHHAAANHGGLRAHSRVKSEAPSKDSNQREAASSCNPNQQRPGKGKAVGMLVANDEFRGRQGQSSPTGNSVHQTEPEETQSQEGKESRTDDNNTILEMVGEHEAANRGELEADSNMKSQAPSKDRNQREAASSSNLDQGGSKAVAVVANDESNSDFCSSELDGKPQGQSSATGNPIHSFRPDKETQSQQGKPSKATDNGKTKLERDGEFPAGDHEEPGVDSKTKSEGASKDSNQGEAAASCSKPDSCEGPAMGTLVSIDQVASNELNGEPQRQYTEGVSSVNCDTCTCDSAGGSKPSSQQAKEAQTEQGKGSKAAGNDNPNLSQSSKVAQLDQSNEAQPHQGKEAKTDGGTRNKPMQSDASSLKGKSRRRLSIAQKQPGERPRMDWTDKQLVKRESMRYLQQKKTKEQAAAKGETNTTEPSRRPMDWTNATLVKRESMRYLEQKKMKEQAVAKGESYKLELGKGPTHEQGNNNSANEKSALENAKLKEGATKPKLEKRSKSKASLLHNKEAKPKLEEKLRSKSNAQASVANKDSRCKKPGSPNTSNPKTEYTADERQVTSKTQIRSEKMKLAGKPLSKSRAMGNKPAASSLRFRGEDEGKAPPDIVKGEEAARKELQGKKSVPKNKEKQGQSDKRSKIQSSARAGEKTNPKSVATQKHRSKKAGAIPHIHGKVEASGKNHVSKALAQLDHDLSKPQAKSNTTTIAKKNKPRKVKEESKRVRSADRDAHRDDYSATANENMIPKEVEIVDPDNIEVTSMRTAETDQSSIDDATEGAIGKSQHTCSESCDVANPSKNRKDEAETNKNTNKSEKPKPQGEHEKKEGKDNEKKTKSRKPTQSDRGLFAIEDASSSSNATAGSKQRRRGSMGGVTDMPARRRQEVVATTCGCWPFGWFK